MNVQELTPNNAMIIGSDFWILPKSNQSNWVQKIDWHCNFQFEKTDFKELKFLSDSIKKIAATEGMDIKDIRVDDQAPVMLVGESYLPCKYIVQLPYTDSESWVKAISELKNSLKQPKLRVFLPKNFSRDEFYRLSKKHFSPEDDLSFVAS